MTNRAICVGINDYSARSDCPSLPDARPDGEAWAGILRDVFNFDAGNVTLLTDGAATRQAVLAALNTVLNQSQAGDVVCFFFAGHGGRNPKGDGTWYETICCADASGDITDSEIDGMANALAPSTVNFTLILDSCHSGGVYDIPSPSDSLRCIRWDDGKSQSFAQNCRALVPHICLPDPSAIAGNVTVSRADDGTMQMTINDSLNFSDGAKATLLAACRYDQNSAGTGSHGKFTQALLDVINQCGLKITHPDLLDRVRTAITTYTQTQIPQLRGRPVRLQENFLQGWNYSI